MQPLRKTLLSYFFSLSAGKKIGLFALLVILLALPLSLTALRQRQETRKKAAELPSPAAPEVVFGKVVVRFRGPVGSQGYRVESEGEDGTIDQLSLLKQRFGVTEEKPLQLEQKPARVDPGGLRVQSEEEAEQTKNDTIEVLTYSADADPFGVARQFENLPQVAWAEPVFVYHAIQEATEAGSQPTGTEPQTPSLGGETASPTPVPTSSTNPTVCNYPSPPDDTYYCSGDQWSLQKIHAYDAWQVTTGSDSTIVAVVDSGVDLNHQDLAANLLPGKNLVDGSDNPQDDIGHGTHVAGIIGAVGNNSIGISGINWRVKILPVKVLDSNGAGHSDTIAEGISWAVAHGAKVINLSLGGPGESQLMTEVINDAYRHGVTVVAAAGNSSLPAEDFFPASTPHVVTVTATGPGDESSVYTNYGSTVEVSAPGGNSGDRSTTCQNTTCILSSFPQDSYRAFQGTSMAAPHVAGLAALVLAKQPNLTPDQVEAVLENSADDLAEPGWDPYFGWGRINAEKALTQTDTTPLPFARLQVGETTKGTVGFSATVRGTYRIDQAPTKDGPWSNEGIVLTDPQPGTDGEVITGSYTPPDGYKGTRFLRVTAESQSGKIRYALRETYIDPTLTTISLPFYNSFNVNVADVDGDGQEDIVLANQDRIAVVNQEGALLPGWPQAFDLSGAGSVIITAVGELDKNYPGKEVVAITQDIPDEREFKLMAWHADGTAVDGWPTSTFRNQQFARNRIVLADLDKDGADEVIFTDSPKTKPATLYVLSGNGQELGGFPQTLPGINVVPPLVADLDGDGQLEIALLLTRLEESRSAKYLWAVNAKGVVLPNLPKELFSGIHSLLAATGDINGDGKDEIVVFQNNILSFPGEEGAGSSAILIVAGTGQILQERIINTTSFNIRNLSATLSIADLAGDGKARIILSGVESRIHILNERGEDTQNPLDLNDTSFIFTTLAKRDNNGDSELIVAGENNAGDYILKRFKSSGGPFTEESTVTFPYDYASAFGTQNPSGILLSRVDRSTYQNSALGIGTDPGVWMWQQRFGDPKLAHYYANTDPVQKRSYSLFKGWNLFGLGLNPEQKLVARDLAEKLKSITGGNVAIIGFDPGKGQALAHFTNPEKAVLNNLEEITLGRGYWVRVEKDAQFELTGTRPLLPQQVAFKTGWQLVSFPYLPDGYDAPSFANKLKELTGGNTIIIGFDPGKGQALAHFTDPEKAVLNNLNKLEHKRGYWLRVEADIAIKVNSDGTVEKFEQ